MFKAYISKLTTSQRMKIGFTGSLAIFGVAFYFAKGLVAQRRKAELDEYRRRDFKPNQFSRAFMIVGGLTAATLFGSYYLRLQHKKREQAAGENPMHEQVLGLMARKPRPGEELEAVKWKYSQKPPALPGSEHHSGHALRDHSNWKKTPQYAEVGDGVRFMEPTPQRGRKDGSKTPYTKSPDYTDNYGKTKRAKDVGTKFDAETGVPAGAPAPVVPS